MTRRSLFPLLAALALAACGRKGLLKPPGDDEADEP